MDRFNEIISSDDFAVWVMVGCVLAYSIYTLVTAPVA